MTTVFQQLVRIFGRVRAVQDPAACPDRDHDDTIVITVCRRIFRHFERNFLSAERALIRAEVNSSLIATALHTLRPSSRSC